MLHNEKKKLARKLNLVSPYTLPDKDGLSFSQSNHFTSPYWEKRKLRIREKLRREHEKQLERIRLKEVTK